MTTGFSGTVSAWLAVCREKDANEGAGWWKEGHENIGNPGWGCNTCEKRILHQSNSAFWERAVRGSASKGNTSGHQNERWRHHYTVNGRFYDGTLKRLWRRQEDGSQGHVPVKKNYLSPVETPPSYQGWRNNLRKCRYWSLTLEYSGN